MILSGTRSVILEIGIGEISIVHALESANNLSTRQPIGIEDQDLIVHTHEASLILMHQLRLKTIFSVSRR